MSKSNAEQVVLKKVQINSSGRYKCEVRPGHWAGEIIIIIYNGYLKV